MKTKVVHLKDLAIRALFIEAKNLPNYHVFRKTGRIVARTYNNNDLVKLSEMQKIIIVTETTFGELPVAQFALTSSAKAPGGIIIPFDILIKCPQPLFRDVSGPANYIDNARTCQSVYIDYKEPVINLDGIFNFKEITIATLNI